MKNQEIFRKTKIFLILFVVFCFPLVSPPLFPPLFCGPEYRVYSSIGTTTYRVQVWRLFRKSKLFFVLVLSCIVPFFPKQSLLSGVLLALLLKNWFLSPRFRLHRGCFPLLLPDDSIWAPLRLLPIASRDCFLMPRFRLHCGCFFSGAALFFLSFLPFYLLRRSSSHISSQFSSFLFGVDGGILSGGRGCPSQ